MKRLKKLFNVKERNNNSSYLEELKEQLHIRFRWKVDWNWSIYLEYDTWDWWKDISDNKRLLWFMKYSDYRWKNKYLYWRPWTDHCNYKWWYWITEEWMKTFLTELKEEYTKGIKENIDYLEKQDIVYYID